MRYDSIALSIGKTPVIRLNRMSCGSNEIYVKTEGRNPTGSIKDRVAYAMLDDAEKSGVLKHGMTILEPTSGNTGIGLCSIGKALGYDVAIVMPENMSVERRKLMQGLGGELVLTDASLGMGGAISRAESILQESPGKYYMPNQFVNQANPAIHVLTTGPEIDLDMDGRVDAVIAGVGTGGTISGIGYYFKKIKDTKVDIIAVEPAKSPVITQKLAGKELRPYSHGIEGIGAGFIPATLDLSLLDHVYPITDEEAFEYASKLMKEEGVTTGISGGAALCAAFKAIDAQNLKGKKLLVILPDSCEKYLSTKLYS